LSSVFFLTDLLYNALIMSPLSSPPYLNFWSMQARMRFGRALVDLGKFETQEAAAKAVDLAHLAAEGSAVELHCWDDEEVQAAVTTADNSKKDTATRLRLAQAAVTGFRRRIYPHVALAEDMAAAAAAANAAQMEANALQASMQAGYNAMVPMQAGDDGMGDASQMPQFGTAAGQDSSDDEDRGMGRVGSRGRKRAGTGSQRPRQRARSQSVIASQADGMSGGVGAAALLSADSMQHDDMMMMQLGQLTEASQSQGTGTQRRRGEAGASAAAAAKRKERQKGAPKAPRVRSKAKGQASSAYGTDAAGGMGGIGDGGEGDEGVEELITFDLPFMTADDMLDPMAGADMGDASTIDAALAAYLQNPDMQHGSAIAEAAAAAAAAAAASGGDYPYFFGGDDLGLGDGANDMYFNGENALAFQLGGYDNQLGQSDGSFLDPQAQLITHSGPGSTNQSTSMLNQNNTQTFSLLPQANSLAPLSMQTERADASLQAAELGRLLPAAAALHSATNEQVTPSVASVAAASSPADMHVQNARPEIASASGSMFAPQQLGMSMVSPWPPSRMILTGAGSSDGANTNGSAGHGDLMTNGSSNEESNTFHFPSDGSARQGIGAHSFMFSSNGAGQDTTNLALFGARAFAARTPGFNAVQPSLSHDPSSSATPGDPGLLNSLFFRGNPIQSSSSVAGASSLLGRRGREEHTNIDGPVSGTTSDARSAFSGPVSSGMHMLPLGSPHVAGTSVLSGMSAPHVFSNVHDQGRMFPASSIASVDNPHGTDTNSTSSASQAVHQGINRNADNRVLPGALLPRGSGWDHLDVLPSSPLKQTRFLPRPGMPPPSYPHLMSGGLASSELASAEHVAKRPRLMPSQGAGDSGAEGLDYFEVDSQPLYATGSMQPDQGSGFGGSFPSARYLGSGPQEEGSLQGFSTTDGVPLGRLPLDSIANSPAATMRRPSMPLLPAAAVSLSGTGAIETSDSSRFVPQPPINRSASGPQMEMADDILQSALRAAAAAAAAAVASSTGSVIPQAAGGAVPTSGEPTGAAEAMDQLASGVASASMPNADTVADSDTIAFEVNGAIITLSPEEIAEMVKRMQQQDQEQL
jgi:hypothetical protein